MIGIEKAIEQGAETIRCTIGPVSIDGVRVSNGEAWATQAQIAQLFEVSVKTVSEHISSILADGELKADITIRSFRNVIPAKAGSTRSVDVSHYSADMVLAVGYRVRSMRGVEYRQWVTNVLKTGARPSFGPVPPLLQAIVRQEQADEYGIMWPNEFAEHMCKLYRKPYSGRQPQWMAGVYRRLYDLVAGSPAMQEIKLRNPEPRYGQNHHQWFTPKARDALSRQVGAIVMMAKQSARADEFWQKIEFEYAGQPLQLGFVLRTTRALSAKAGK